MESAEMKMFMVPFNKR